MTADAHPWTVRLTKTAESDFQSIIVWTLREFGDLQARIYADTLSAALVAPTAGPTAIGAKERSEIGKNIYVACSTRRTQGPTLRVIPRQSGQAPAPRRSTAATPRRDGSDAAYPKE